MDSARSLREAAWAGDVPTVQRVCALPSIDVNARNEYGSSPLHYACLNGHTAVVARLFEHPSIDINATDKYGRTPLHRACLNGHPAVVEQLCAQPSIDVNSKDKYLRTPLHRACLNGHAAVVGLLCAHPSVNVNVEDNDGYTPLHWACINGHAPVAEHLCAQPTIEVNAKDNDGYTPLHRACVNDHAEAVQYLCAQSSIDVNAKDNAGYTPLHWACINGHVAVVEYLCAHPSIDVNLEDTYSYMQLHRACINGHAAVVAHLCAQPTIDVNTKDNDGYTSLHWACSNGHAAVVEQLCAQASIDVNAEDNDGYTPLHRACLNGHAAVVELLCAHAGIDVNAKGLDGYAPLYHACINGHTAVMERMFTQPGTDVNTKDTCGLTPLHWACMHGHTAVVKHLCEQATINVNAKDNDGCTPLHSACGNGNSAVVDHLCAHPSIDVNAEDESGRTPLHCASRNGHPGVVEHLCAQPGIDPDSAALELSAASGLSASFALRECCPPQQQLLLSSDYANDAFLEQVEQWLPGLRVLVVDGGGDSLLTTLPALANVQYVEVRGCPLLQCPPKEFMRAGPTAAAGYLRDLAKGDARECRKLRVMLVGKTEAGKSSFADALHECAAHGEAVALPGRSKVDRTVGIDVSWFVVKRPDGGLALELSCWDCGGHDPYHPTHTLFMAPQGLYTLVVRLDEGVEAAVESAQVWLDAIHAVVPCARVMLVCTRADYFDSWQPWSDSTGMSQARAVAADVHSAVAHSLRQRKDRLQARAAAFLDATDSGAMHAAVAGELKRVAHDVPVLLPEVACVSATKGSGVAEALERIVAVSQDNRVFPHLSMKHPHCLFLLLDRVRRGEAARAQNADQRAPDDVAAAATAPRDTDHSEGGETVRSRGTRPAAVQEGLRGNEGVAIWEAFRDTEYEACGFAADADEGERESTMRAAVELAHNTGLLVYRPHTQHVFLDPQWIVDAIKAVISHNYHPVFVKSPQCFSCGEEFSWLVGQHHCRRCCRSFCDACSRGCLPVPERGVFAPRRARVCDACAAVLSERPLHSEHFVGISAEDAASDTVQLQTTGLLTRRLLCGALWWKFHPSVHPALVDILCGDFALLVPVDGVASSTTDSGGSDGAGGPSSCSQAAGPASAAHSFNAEGAGTAPHSTDSAGVAARGLRIAERFWVPLLFPPSPEAEHGWQRAAEGGAGSAGGAMRTHRRLLVFDFLPFGFMERLVAQWLRQATREDTGFSVDSDHRWRDAVQLRRTTPTGCEVVRVTMCKAPRNVTSARESTCLAGAVDPDAPPSPVVAAAAAAVTRRDLSLRIVAWLEPRRGEHVGTHLATWSLTASVLQSIDDMRTTWFNGCPTPRTYAPCPSCVQRGTPQPHMFSHLAMLRRARVKGNGATDVCAAWPPCCGVPALVTFDEVFPVHDVDTVRLREALGDTERRVEAAIAALQDARVRFEDTQELHDELLTLAWDASADRHGAVLLKRAKRSVAAAAAAVAAAVAAHEACTAAVPDDFPLPAERLKLVHAFEDAVVAMVTCTAACEAAVSAASDNMQLPSGGTEVSQRSVGSACGGGGGGSVMPVKVTRRAGAGARGGAGGASKSTNTSTQASSDAVTAATMQRATPSGSDVSVLEELGLRNPEVANFVKLERCIVAIAEGLRSRVVQAARSMAKSLEATETKFVCHRACAWNKKAEERAAVLEAMHKAPAREKPLLSEQARKLKAAADAIAAEGIPCRKCRGCDSLRQLRVKGEPQWDNVDAESWCSPDGFYFELAKLFLPGKFKQARAHTVDVGACVTLIEMCQGKAFSRLRKRHVLATLRAARDVRNCTAHAGAGAVTTADYEKHMQVIKRTMALTEVFDKSVAVGLKSRIEDIDAAAAGVTSVHVYKSVNGGPAEDVGFVAVRGTLDVALRLIREACQVPDRDVGVLRNKATGDEVMSMSHLGSGVGVTYDVQRS